MINVIEAALFWFNVNVVSAEPDAWRVLQAAVTCWVYVELAQQANFADVDSTVLSNSYALLSSFLASLPEQLQLFVLSARSQMMQQIGIQLQTDPANALAQIKQISQVCVTNIGQTAGY